MYANGRVFTPAEFALEAVEAETGKGTHDHVVFETAAPPLLLILSWPVVITLSPAAVVAAADANQSRKRPNPP